PLRGGHHLEGPSDPAVIVGDGEGAAVLDLLVERAAAAAPRALSPIEGAAAHPRDEPGLHGAAPTVVVPGAAPHLEEDVVEHVLRVVLVAEQRSTEAEQAWGVAIVECGERLPIPGGDRRDEVLVGVHGGARAM